MSHRHFPPSGNDGPSGIDFMTPEVMSRHKAPPIQYHQFAEDARLAYRHLKVSKGSEKEIASRHEVLFSFQPEQPTSPTLLYVPGFNSNMEVYKALAMEQYAKENGLGSVRYDQRAIGNSSGER